MVSYCLVLYLLALCSSQRWVCLVTAVKIGRFSGYDSKMGQVFDVPPLPAKTGSKTSSRVLFDIVGREIRWISEIQFVKITSFRAVWLEIGGVSGSSAGVEIFIADP